MRGAPGLRMAIAVLTFVSCVSHAQAPDLNPPATSAPGVVVTLPQMVDQALKNGPGILISRATVAIAQAQYTQTAAANSLGLTGTASATHQGAPYDTRLLQLGQSSFAQDTGKAGLSLSAPLSTSLDVAAGHTLTEEATPAQSTALSVSASATLWDGYPGGSGLAAARKAALSLQGTQSAEDSNQKTIVYQVKQAYYTLLAAQRQLEIYQDTLAQRQQETVRSRALYDAHNASQIDIKQAQVNQKQAELDLRLAQGTLEVERERLSALVGWPLDRAYQAAEVGDLPLPDLDVSEAVARALAHRSDMRQLVLNQASTDIDLALNKGKSTPVVKATSGLTYTHDWSRSTDVFSWNAGVNVAAPIYDAGSIDAQVRQAVTQKSSYTLQQQQLASSIATDVKDALYALRDLIGRVELAQESLDLAQSQYDLARLQYDSGVNSNLDVLAASVAMTTARVNEGKARSDAQLGVLALQNAMGE
jgi:outer membrane protein TolC